MDSGNSGSMQSSSGGDEEYDSRNESISAFINLPPSSHHHHHNPSLSLFDPLSNYLDSFPRSPTPPNMNSLLNLDAGWTKAQQSDPNGSDIGRVLMGSSSLSSPISISDRSPFPLTSSNISPQLVPGSENGGRVFASTDQSNVRSNPKKRSRASRRAPTTVLTTDTSNFRAMVQEFTGIPAPPFSSSPFPKARFDLFNTASSMRSKLSNPPLPPYLLRPFAQKLQQQQQQNQSIFGSLPLSTSSNGTSTTATSTNNNEQLPCDLGGIKQHPDLINPSFTFQSQAPKYPFASLQSFTAKSQGSLTIPSTGSHLKMGLLPLEEFGMNNTQLGTLTNLVASDAMSLRVNDPPSWGDGVGSNYSNSQRVSSCKMNYTGSSSDFHAEKGSENVSSRGEGMVDSWICSTD